MTRVSSTRREFLRRSLLAGAGIGMAAWSAPLAHALAAAQGEGKQCILLWMNGGPSQMDTFDMKPNHANGGEFQEISTSVPGIRFSEHLPQLATQADKLSIIRGLSTKEGDHGRGTYLAHTGYRPGGPVRYPAIGSALAKELAQGDADLPGYVSILPFVALNPAAFSPGFLGPEFAPASVGLLSPPGTNSNDDGEEVFPRLGVNYLRLPESVSNSQFEGRLRLWDTLQASFLESRPTEAVLAQDTVYRRAIRVLQSDASSAFELDGESTKVRESYGRTPFGQGCLIARRLVERGVPFVEVNLGGFDPATPGWDTHLGNFPSVRSLSQQLDTAWSTLMRELDERGMLEKTTLLWIGEFGRTPNINNNAGRDHFPQAWSCVMAGGGIQGGSVYGKTSDDGMEVVEDRVEIADVLATLCKSAGVNPGKENISDLGRPIAISEGSPIESILS